jgi:hypothetical protein
VGLLCLCHILPPQGTVGDGLCLEIMELSPTARITARGERCNGVYTCPPEYEASIFRVDDPQGDMQRLSGIVHLHSFRRMQTTSGGREVVNGLVAVESLGWSSSGAHRAHRRFADVDYCTNVWWPAD